ncbi:Uncharacterised protein [Mycobacteroides abscessus subsp. abscessus]|nr:Uncharacterised protein [Mycobacteroides abscessus subsp. abscessus]
MSIRIMVPARHFIGFAAAIGGSDIGCRLHLGNRLIPLIFIYTVGICHNIGRCKFQDIRTKYHFRRRCIKNSKKMRVILQGYFVMPPALRYIGNLSWSDRIVLDILCKRIQQGNSGLSGYAVDQFCSVLVVMGFYSIAGA